MKSHINSKLSLMRTPIPIDTNTSLLCHYDITTTSFNGIAPTADTTILTGLRQSVITDGNNGLTASYDGKYGGAAVIAETTTNLMPNGDFSNGTTGWSISTQQDTVMNCTCSVKQESGYPYLNVHWERLTGSGNNWPFIRSVAHYTTPGTYTLSCEIRINKMNYTTTDVAAVRHSAMDNDYGSTGQVMWGFGSRQFGVWQKVTLTRTFAATQTLGGTAYNMNACFELYSGNMDVAGEYVDFDIRNIQIEQKAYATYFTKTSRASAASMQYPISIINKAEGTISFWFKYSSIAAIATGGITENPLFSNGNAEAANAFDLLFGSDSTNGRFYYRKYYGNNSSTSCQMSYDMPSDKSNTWIMVTCTWKDANFMKLYLNGLPVVSSTTNVNFTDMPGSFCIGNGIRSVPNFMIDELRVDKIARTDEEILSWYISQCPFYIKERYKLVR